jgi:Legume lectin domain
MPQGGVMNYFVKKVRVLAPLALLGCLSFATQPARAQQPLSFPNFNSTDGLTLNGAAVVASNGNANVLRITPATGTAVGSAWTTNTVPLKAGFTTTFTFQFTQQGGLGGADGIAFVVQNSSAGAGYIDSSIGGSVGYGDDDVEANPGTGVTNSIAVEFDTFTNGWDPNNNHVSIQSCFDGSNSQHHDKICLTGQHAGSSPTLALNSTILSAQGINLSDGAPHTAVITYSLPCAGCLNFSVNLDGKPVAAVPFDLASLGGLGANDDAYVGFTASTGGGFENQDIISWNFSAQTITQPVSQGQPNTFSFSNTQGSELVHVLDFSAAKGNLTFPNGDPDTLVVQSTNTSVDATTWPQYVYGGPFATSVLFPLVEDNGNGGLGTNGGLFVDLCYDPTKTGSPATPSDANCPFVSSGSDNFLGVDVTADLVSKPPIVPGTISVLAHYEPPSATPLLPWSPSTINGTTPNAACTTTTGSVSAPQQPAPPTNCFVADAELTISGDSTTSSGKVRNKGTFAFAYSVPMLESTVSVNGKQVNLPGVNNPSSSAGIWFSAQNAPLNLSFLVNPACPPAPASCTADATNNFFRAAPVASETFSVTKNGNAAVPTTGATAPAGFNTATVQPVTFTGIVNGSSVPDGTYFLQWSATDNVGIPEQFQQLVPFSVAANPQGTCSDGSPVSASGACYNTSSFTAALNVDSTSPTVTVTSPTNTTYTSGQKVAAAYSCIDPTPGAGLAGGTAGCQGSVANKTNIDTTPSGPGTTTKTFTVTSADAAIPANTTSKSVTYSVTCHYAVLSVNPNSVKRPALIGVTASVADCMPASQSVSVKFTLSGPLGRNCSNDSTVMFTTPNFTIKSGASNSITFPFIIPGNVCAGTYTISTATIQSGTTVDTSTATLTVR